MFGCLMHVSLSIPLGFFFFFGPVWLFVGPSWMRRDRITRSLGMNVFEARHGDQSLVLGPRKERQAFTALLIEHTRLKGAL